MTRFDMLRWIPCDSRSDMEARASGEKNVVTLLTADANTWGYIQTSEDWRLNIGYANIGLIPQSVVVGKRLFIGINECLVGYNLLNGAGCFSYRMPFVFHEFIKVDDSLIVRDEMGFIGLTLNGNELWKFGTESVIKSYAIVESKIIGKTIEGKCFLFNLPIKK